MLAEVFGMISALLSSVVYDNGKFGELFMRCNQGNKSAGPFFPPYHISQFMAKAALGDEVVEKAEKDEILTHCDPETWRIWKTPSFIFQQPRFFQFDNYN